MNAFEKVCFKDIIISQRLFYYKMRSPLKMKKIINYSPGYLSNKFAFTEENCVLIFAALKTQKKVRDDLL
jgi:hypothetical protein